MDDLRKQVEGMLDKCDRGGNGSNIEYDDLEGNICKLIEDRELMAREDECHKAFLQTKYPRKEAYLLNRIEQLQAQRKDGEDEKRR